MFTSGRRRNDNRVMTSRSRDTMTSRSHDTCHGQFTSAVIPELGVAVVSVVVGNRFLLIPIDDVISSPTEQHRNSIFEVWRHVSEELMSSIFLNKYYKCTYCRVQTRNWRDCCVFAHQTFHIDIGGSTALHTLCIISKSIPFLFLTELRDSWIQRGTVCIKNLKKKTWVVPYRVKIHRETESRLVKYNFPRRQKAIFWFNTRKNIHM